MSEQFLGATVNHLLGRPVRKLESSTELHRAPCGVALSGVIDDSENWSRVVELNHVLPLFRQGCYRHTHRGWQRAGESNSVMAFTMSPFSRRSPTIQCCSLLLAISPRYAPLPETLRRAGCHPEFHRAVQHMEEDQRIELCHDLHRVAVFKTVERHRSPSSLIGGR